MPPKPQEPVKEEPKGPPPKPKVYTTEDELLRSLDVHMLTVIEKLQPVAAASGDKGKKDAAPVPVVPVADEL